MARTDHSWLLSAGITIPPLCHAILAAGGIDRFSDTKHFLIGGIARDIRFTGSNAKRAIVSVQVVTGVVLMLFGFYNVMTCAREQRG